MTRKWTLLNHTLISPLLPRRPGVSDLQKSRDQFVICILLSAYLYILFINLFSRFALSPIEPIHTIISVFSLIVLIGATVSVAILKFTGQRAVALNTFIAALSAAFTWAALQTGGLFSPINPCVIILPILAIMGISVRAGIAWSIALFLAAYTLFSADQQGIHFHSVIPEKDLSIAVFAGLSTATSFIIFITIYYDLTSRTLHKQFEDEHNKYIHLAHHDSLTGIANRRHFINEIESAIYNAKLVNTSFSVLFFDLNQFKEINDTGGHHIGDTILVEFAKRLRSHTRATDVVARLGGDEFSILLLGLCDKNIIKQKISTYLLSLDEPIHIENITYLISASVGYAIYPDNGHDYESLLRAADQNMYKVKNTHKNAITK
ncbi:putative signaling protein [Zhongshania aliphaticivorans]|uniref:Putative signaling protein n=1 Tax=Zhongshania aliphaticivorans TaxID=1470434 RepID=A0A5S9NWF8_9GAMM|nr:GGDEF domain-containing protein [Zhongshania aliphaticivorans]CAA0094922.1 putative signaling protein [Zhongshania aliphaticivorans]